MARKIFIFAFLCLALAAIIDLCLPKSPAPPIISHTISLPPSQFEPAFVPRAFIPGGVYDIARFRAALLDPALAKQFAGFNFRNARFEKLLRSSCLFVAYRDGARFAWTRRCKILRSGELILTDGRFRVRARCGNLLSGDPQAPTFASGIDEDISINPETAVDPPTNLKATVSVPPPPSPNPVVPINPSAPPFPNPPCFSCASVPNPPVCTNCTRYKTPEGGSTLTYVLIGLFVIAVAYAYK